MNVLNSSLGEVSEARVHETMDLHTIGLLRKILLASKIPPSPSQVRILSSAPQMRLYIPSIFIARIRNHQIRLKFVFKLIETHFFLFLDVPQNILVFAACFSHTNTTFLSIGHKKRSETRKNAWSMWNCIDCKFCMKCIPHASYDVVYHRQTYVPSTQNVYELSTL